jgi:hypothetical protein
MLSLLKYFCIMYKQENPVNAGSGSARVIPKKEIFDITSYLSGQWRLGFLDTTELAVVIDAV